MNYVNNQNDEDDDDVGGGGDHDGKQLRKVRVSEFLIWLKLSIQYFHRRSRLRAIEDEICTVHARHTI